MAGDKIRLGVIGANANRGWAPVAHLPAVVASPDYELTAVCTSRRESAEESARRYGARLAFHDHRDLLACPDIDAVAVVVKVTNHYQLTMDAIQAGKHVYTEWPLATNLAKASGDGQPGSGKRGPDHGWVAGARVSMFTVHEGDG